ncbi:FkbM family methyltransferase [Tabrizicola sp.]|uniref:FkbM family methyltransferase n=1 Tax=Tabrizicola sp. TaxID=2005166 RepID=UPI003F41A08C
MRWRGTQTTIRYRGLDVPLQRTGMNDEVLMSIARNGYEQPEIDALRHAVRPGDRVLELGSGLGIVTALAARAAAPNGRVLSFEANPEMIPATREFLADHQVTNVELRHAVLVPQAKPGETRDLFLGGSFNSSSLLGAPDHTARGVVSVPAEPLNDVVADFRPDVLICDIEGAEAELLPALDAQGLRAAVVELHPDRLSGDEIAAIHAAMARHGLHLDPTPLGGTVVLYSRLPPS